MADQRLEDSRGHILGFIRSEGGGRLRLESNNGYTLGYYDPRRNETTDKGGRVVGRGNLLTTLLK